MNGREPLSSMIVFAALNSAPLYGLTCCVVCSFPMARNFRRGSPALWYDELRPHDIVQVYNVMYLESHFSAEWSVYGNTQYCTVHTDASNYTTPGYQLVYDLYVLHLSTCVCKF
eukprot:SAG22_NODE_416_length_10804_cov_4.791126_3_plen_114_part_00